ncbi:hypothetical protein C8R47DRAFT_966399 [Mycena vitilis]|nr:hypothetical protein C8R47DRAFT_966399 [Mycena vitilis]
MFATFLTLALFAASSLNAVAADFSVATPTNVTQCKPVQFTWEATKGPYNLIIVKSAEPCGAVMQELGDHPNPSMTWTTNLTAGVDYTLSVEDANGDEGWSEAMTVLAGTDTSCLNNAAAVPSSASGASASGKSSLVPFMPCFSGR